MDGRVAFVTDYQRFTTGGRHYTNPPGPFGLPVSFKVFESPNVMDADVVLRTTQFTLIGEEPPNQLRRLRPTNRWLVVQYGVDLPLQ
jgi:hypothetical protein